MSSIVSSCLEGGFPNAVQAWFPRALSRTIATTVIVGSSLLGCAAFASASTPSAQLPVGHQLPATPQAPLGTIAWVLAGVFALMVGLLAASKSGSRPAAPGFAAHVGPMAFDQRAVQVPHVAEARS